VSAAPAIDTTLGPRPATPRRDPLTHLSVPRAFVLEKLGQFAHPTTVADLADACDQHPNTVREHLDALIRAAWSRGPPRRPVAGAAPPFCTRPSRSTRAARKCASTPSWPPRSPSRSRRPRRTRRRGARPPASGGGWGWSPPRAKARPRLRSPPGRSSSGITSIRSTPRTARSDCASARCWTSRGCTPTWCASLHQGVLTGIYQAHGVADRAMRLTPFALPGCCLIEFPPDPGSGPPVPPAPEPSRRKRRPAARADAPAPPAGP
jgi:hypothetical protein